MLGKPRNPFYSMTWWLNPSPKLLLIFVSYTTTLLVISTYHSNFTENACLNTLTSHDVIKEMKSVFTRYGIPDILITENDP